MKSALQGDRGGFDFIRGGMPKISFELARISSREFHREAISLTII